MDVKGAKDKSTVDFYFSIIYEWQIFEVELQVAFYKFYKFFLHYNHE